MNADGEDDDDDDDCWLHMQHVSMDVFGGRKVPSTHRGESKEVNWNLNILFPTPTLH